MKRVLIFVCDPSQISIPRLLIYMAVVLAVIGLVAWIARRR